MTKGPRDFLKNGNVSHLIIENPILETFKHLSNRYEAPTMPALVTYGYICLGPDAQVTYWLHREALFLFLTPLLWEEYPSMPFAIWPSKNMTSEKVEDISQPHWCWVWPHDLRKQWKVNALDVSHGFRCIGIICPWPLAFAISIGKNFSKNHWFKENDKAYRGDLY